MARSNRKPGSKGKARKRQDTTSKHAEPQRPIKPPPKHEIVASRQIRSTGIPEKPPVRASRQGPIAREKRIEKHEITRLPPLSWKGRIQVLKKPDKMKSVVRELLKEDILGFDTETKPVFRKGHYNPPALVQLAAKKCVYLFQILNEGLDVLRPLLEAEHVLKVGVSVKQDVIELQKVSPFVPAGFVELSDRTRKLGYQQGGLRALTAMILRGQLSKKAQMSNWAKPILDQSQILYAATDAWVGRELYLRVVQEEEDGA